jgi:hypothetical protein
MSNESSYQPTRKALHHWHKKFVVTDCLCPEKKSGRPDVSQEDAESVKRNIHEKSEEISASSVPWTPNAPCDSVESSAQEADYEAIKTAAM